MTTATMPFFTIDTLQFSKRMQKVGLQKEVAEELAEAIKDSQAQSAEGFATKDYVQNKLNESESRLERKIDLVHNEVKIIRKDVEMVRKDFDMVRKDFDIVRKDVETLENKLTVKIFLMLTLAVGVITWLGRVVG